MDRPPDAPDPDPGDGFASLFDFLPIGAYRSSTRGRILRANAALVRLSGYDSEAQLRESVADLASGWYVEGGRRDEFLRRLDRDDAVVGFVSEIYRHRTGERLWVSENAHLVRDAGGRTRYLEGTVEDITGRIREQQALERSEAQFREIAERVPGMVYRNHVDHDGRRRFLYVSQGARELLGVEPRALIDDSALMQRMIHPDDRDSLQAALRESARSGGAMVHEHRLCLADGSLKWVHVASNAVGRDETGVLRVGLIVDITARKAADAALRANDERWKLALEASGDAVWDWNLVTGDEVFSERFRQMYGYGDELADRAEDVDLRTHPDDLAQMLADRQAHFDGLAPSYVNEHRVRCADGSWKWVLTRGLVIARDAQGRPLRMIGTHTDISERKQADALRQQRDRAELANQAKSALLGRVSHELRTPLNAVMGFAQLIAMDGSLPARPRTWAEQIRASGEHLLALVDDVLDLSSLHTGDLRLSPGPVDLAHTIAQTWTMVAAGMPQPVVGFVDRVGDVPRVRADPRRLTQVLANLLGNAVKYNRDGGRVTVRAGSDGDVVRLDVEDTGCGMDADQLARLFSPFDRLGAEHSRVEGRGIGLALTRQLVDAMGGRIEVASRPGEGTVFSVWLPRAAA